MNEPLPAIEAITADLRRRWAARRRLLLLAAATQAMVFVASIAMMGARDDLLDRAVWRMLAEVLGWYAALFALPAIALGLWHPTRGAAIAVVLAVAGGITLAATGLHGDVAAGPLFHGCAMLAAIASILGFVALALVGGVARERTRSGAAWLAFAVAVTGFVAANTVCDRDDVGHVLIGHWGPAWLAGGIVLVIARALRRR